MITEANYRGEEMLAASVVDMLLADIELYERNYTFLLNKKRKNGIYLNAADAISAAFSKNESLELWLNWLEIPLKTFRNHLRKKYPKACELAGNKVVD